METGLDVAIDSVNANLGRTLPSFCLCECSFLSVKFSSIILLREEKRERARLGVTHF